MSKISRFPNNSFLPNKLKEWNGGYAEGGRARQYSPAIPREQAALQETESLLRRVYRGSVGMMVNTLADSRGLSAADIEELSAILEKAKEGQR